MFFCPVCNNTFDIVKPSSDSQKGGKVADSPATETSDEFQTGGSIRDIVQRVINKEEIDVSDVASLDIDKITHVPEYKKLSKKAKELVYNTIFDMLPVEKKLMKEADQSQTQNLAFFKCYNCGEMQPISEGTLIYSQNYKQDETVANVEINTDLIHDPTLRRTRRYTCHNKDCVSHKDLSKREAVMFRMGDSYHINYVCTACETGW